MIIRRELVSEVDFIGETGPIVTVDCTIKRAHMARVEVDTPSYARTVVLE